MAAFVLDLGIVAHREDVVVTMLEKLINDNSNEEDQTRLEWRKIVTGSTVQQ